MTVSGLFTQGWIGDPIGGGTDVVVVVEVRDLTGVIASTETLAGTIASMQQLTGTIEAQDAVVGTIQTVDPVTGIITTETVTGVIDCENT